MAFASEFGYTIGIGLTDRCNFDCPHCYSRPQGPPRDLDSRRVFALLDALPVKSINFGTGESILYPGFVSLVRRLAERGIPMAVTTNGYTAVGLSDCDLALFHDVDFSLDFASAEANDAWRGAGSFAAVRQGARRCRNLGIEASLVACLMKPNCGDMGRLAELAGEWGLNLRVNVYKPVISEMLTPSYHEFWGAIADMARSAYFIACSEPVVKAAIGYRNNTAGSPCGNYSFRIHPDGAVVSCVYLNHSLLTIEDLCAPGADRQASLCEHLQLPLPEICRECEHREICRGGCLARRMLTISEAPDAYCFVARGEDPPPIRALWKPGKGLVHEDYLCTMIFSA